MAVESVGSQILVFKKVKIPPLKVHQSWSTVGGPEFKRGSSGYSVFGSCALKTFPEYTMCREHTMPEMDEHARVFPRYLRIY